MSLFFLSCKSVYNIIIADDFTLLLLLLLLIDLIYIDSDSKKLLIHEILFTTNFPIVIFVLMCGGGDNQNM